MYQVYHPSCVLILLVAAAAKLISAFEDAAVLTEPEPLFGVIHLRQFLILGGSLEILVAICVGVFGRSREGYLILICLCTCFGLYRFGLWLYGIEAPCPCLGNPTKWLGISQQSAANLATATLVYLGTGSFVALFINRHLK